MAQIETMEVEKKQHILMPNIEYLINKKKYYYLAYYFN